MPDDVVVVDVDAVVVLSVVVLVLADGVFNVTYNDILAILLICCIESTTRHHPSDCSGS